MLKIVNAGLGRTGTTSLQLALDRLGYGPGFHMFDIVRDEQRLQRWEGIVCDGEEPDWPTLFEGFSSVVNGPSSVYYRELVKAFPGVKVILTVRDPQKWYRSTYDTLFQFALKGKNNPPEPGSRAARMLRFTNALIWDSVFEGRFADRDFAIDVFERHNAEVRRVVPEQDLLVYEAGQGWGPLCAFLGEAVPDEEFPRANESAAMRGMLAPQRWSPDGPPSQAPWEGPAAAPAES